MTVQVGTDPGAFSRAFRAVHGLPPLAYRRAMGRARIVNRRAPLANRDRVRPGDTGLLPIDPGRRRQP